MKLAASLVEHLVNGSGALVWVTLLLLEHLPSSSAHFPSWGGVLLLPVLYAIGMLVDFAAQLLLHPLEGFVTRRKHGGHKDEESQVVFPSLTAVISLKSQGLAEMLELRAVRQRIARGTFLNLMLTLGVIACFGLPGWLDVNEPVLLVLLVVGLAVSLGCWIRFQKLYEDFRANAYKTLDYLGYLEEVDS